MRINPHPPKPRQLPACQKSGCLPRFAAAAPKSDLASGQHYEQVGTPEKHTSAGWNGLGAKECQHTQRPMCFASLLTIWCLLLLPTVGARAWRCQRKNLPNNAPLQTLVTSKPDNCSKLSRPGDRLRMCALCITWNVLTNICHVGTTQANCTLTARSLTHRLAERRSTSRWAMWVCCQTPLHPTTQLPTPPHLTPNPPHPTPPHPTSCFRAR